MNQFTKMAAENPSYPIRMGQPWLEEEDTRLLKSLQGKKNIQLIADEHQRTIGGIRSRQRVIAVDYYFENKLPIEDIMKYTCLTRTEIENSIEKQNALESAKELRKRVKKDTPSDEIISLLRDINQKLDILINSKFEIWENEFNKSIEKIV